MKVLGSWDSRSQTSNVILILTVTSKVYTIGIYPRGSMYGIFTYIYHKNQPNVGKYTIHYMDPLGIFGIVLYRLEYYTTFVGDEI